MRAIVTAYKLAQIRGTDPHTERDRCKRGQYGPLASTKPLAVYRDEVEKRGITLPPLPEDKAGLVLLRMLDLLLDNSTLNQLQRVAIFLAFATVDTEFKLGLGEMFAEEVSRAGQVNSTTKGDVK